MRRTLGHSLAQNAGDRRVFWLGHSCCTARVWSSFLPLLQVVSSICKTRNQLLLLKHYQNVIAGVKRCRIVKDVLRLTTEGISDLVMEMACGLHNLRVSCRHPFPTFDVLSLLSPG